MAGLVLVMLTGWKPFDPLVAFAVALNILWSGGRLLWDSMKGLLDYSDPKVGHQIRRRLDAICDEPGIQYHGVRFRATGYRHIIEVHLLFPRPWRSAKRIAWQHCWKNVSSRSRNAFGSDNTSRVS